MPRSSSDALFDLVHSLSASEKRYFVAGAQVERGTKGANYLRLYRAVLAQSSYDEPALKAEFASEPWADRFSVAKNYLYNLLLRSLRAYHHNQHHEMELHARLEEVRILVRRELYDQARKVLGRAKKLAEKYDAVFYMPLLLRWERRLVRGAERKHRRSELGRISEEAAAAFEAGEKEWRLGDDYSKVFLMTQERQAGLANAGQGELEALEADLPLEEKNEGFEARMSRLYIRAFSLHIRKDYSNALTAYQRIVEAWEAARHHLSESPNRYAHALVDYLNICHQSGNYADFMVLITKLRGLKGLNMEMRGKVFRMTYNLELLYYINTQQFEAAVALVPAFEAELDRFAPVTDLISQYSYAFNIAVVLFLTEHFSEALRWVNRLRNFEKTPLRKDVQRFVHFLNVMTHWELGHADLVERLLLGIRRNLRPFNAFEEALFSFFQKAVKDGEAHQGPHFETLAKAVQDPAMTVPGAQEVWVWAKGRGEGRPLVEVLGELG